MTAHRGLWLSDGLADRRVCGILYAVVFGPHGRPGHQSTLESTNKQLS